MTKLIINYTETNGNFDEKVVDIGNSKDFTLQNIINLRACTIQVVPDKKKVKEKKETYLFSSFDDLINNNNNNNKNQFNF